MAPSSKRYTNVTFTKRVDHDGGRRRPASSPAEPLVCTSCGAVFADRRWWTKEEAAAAASQHPHWRPEEPVVCPACQQIRSGTPSGFVYLQGAFLDEHVDEITRLLENEAERAAQDNPLARVMATARDERGRLVVTTTTEHLAQRLGHALEKAFKGSVRYDFSHENKLARVYWQRET